MYVLTDRTKEVIAAAVDTQNEGLVFTSLLPGPGQKLHYLPDVPDAIESIRDGARFSAELTRYFRSRRGPTEIDTLKGAAFLKQMRDRWPRS